jgi:hypothetical protein
VKARRAFGIDAQGSIATFLLAPKVESSRDFDVFFIGIFVYAQLSQNMKHALPAMPEWAAVCRCRVSRLKFLLFWDWRMRFERDGRDYTPIPAF